MQRLSELLVELGRNGFSSKLTHYGECYYEWIINYKNIDIAILTFVPRDFNQLSYRIMISNVVSKFCEYDTINMLYNFVNTANRYM